MYHFLGRPKFPKKAFKMHLFSIFKLKPVLENNMFGFFYQGSNQSQYTYTGEFGRNSKDTHLFIRIQPEIFKKAIIFNSLDIQNYIYSGSSGSVSSIKVSMESTRSAMKEKTENMISLFPASKSEQSEDSKNWYKKWFIPLLEFRFLRTNMFFSSNKVSTNYPTILETIQLQIYFFIVASESC